MFVASESSSFKSMFIFPVNFSTANQEKYNFKEKERGGAHPAEDDYFVASATLCLCLIVSEEAP